MAWRWLLTLGVHLSLIAAASAQTRQASAAPAATTSVGHLLTADPVAETRTKPVPYQPQPGDILLYDDFNRLFHAVFKLASTAPPTHTSMVIAGADGKPALLELTGPKVITARVQVMDVDTRLQSYPGTVMVRRIREPLTPEQSQDLTQFAYAQQGKSFAAGRVALMVTPFCARTGLRQELFGHTYMNRNRWFCSELVVAACSKAKILDGNKCCANALFPHDLAVDRRLDLSATHHAPLFWTPDGAAAPAPIINASGSKR